MYKEGFGTKSSDSPPQKSDRVIRWQYLHTSTHEALPSLVSIWSHVSLSKASGVGPFHRLLYSDSDERFLILRSLLLAPTKDVRHSLAQLI